MSLSVYNINKWIKMLTGKSILHVNQGIGRIYSVEEIKGYYNDLTEKVTKDKEIDKIKIPTYKIESGQEIFFPISIFQYGIAAYDLYLIKKEELFLKKFKLCADWALENQNDNGSWECFHFIYPRTPYSAMAQGEGVSLLIRAYKEFNNSIYLKAAEEAIYFMIKHIKDGGTTKYEGKEVYLQEFTNKPTVLNGWIFSLWGLFDYLKVVDDKKLKKIYIKSLNTLASNIHRFDNGYWSKYNLGNMISSPFYHKLHIAQLKVMYTITNIYVFKQYAEKWEKYSNNYINKTIAFIVKVIQKILE